MRDDIEKLAERFGVPQDWIKILLMKENKVEKPRQVVSVGWDGANQPMYRFLDQLPLSDHLRDRPTAEQVKVWKTWWESSKEIQPAVTKPYIFDRVKFVSELLQEHGQHIGELLSSPPETMAEFAACLAEAAHFHENMGEALRQIAQIAILYDDIHCHCGEDGYAKVNGKVLCPNHYEASLSGTHFDAEVEALDMKS